MEARFVSFPDYGNWKVTKKLSKKTRIADPDWEWKPSELHAVYECSQLDGSSPGQVAILKLRIQVPCTFHDCGEPPSDDEGAKYAQKGEYAETTRDEIRFLRRLTEARCSAAPKLLAVKEGTQEISMLTGECEYKEDVLVRGGYIVWILMEKVPGEDLFYFATPGKYSLEERQEIRNEFRKAYTMVERCGVLLMDNKRENVIWDRRSKRCFMIDFEDATEWAEDVPEGYMEEWSDDKYVIWDLAEKSQFNTEP